MNSKFEKVYQKYASKLENDLHISERMEIWEAAKAEIGHDDKNVQRMFVQYSNDRALDGMTAKDAWEHTCKLNSRAVAILEAEKVEEEQEEIEEVEEEQEESLREQLEEVEKEIKNCSDDNEGRLYQLYKKMKRIQQEIEEQ